MRIGKKTAVLASVLGLSACVPAGAAVVMSFDNDTAGNPFRTSVVDSATTVTGSITDPVYNGGTTFSVTLSQPRTGVDISTPTAPVFTGASASYFGTEGTGFGVGDGTTGRFTRGETFTFTSTQPVTIDSMTFHEWTGDEDLHISWTKHGVPHSQVFSMASGTGSVPSNVTVLISGLETDANLPVVITNVSPGTANSSGRLRFRKIAVSAVPEPTSLVLLMAPALLALRRRR